MVGHQAAAFAWQVVIGLGVALLVYVLLSRSLRNLLHEVVGFQAGVTFYLRSLLLILLFMALAKVITQPQLKPDSHSMEAVWAVASVLSDLFGDLFGVLLAYLGLITVLTAVLQRKNAK